MMEKAEKDAMAANSKKEENNKLEPIPIIVIQQVIEPEEELVGLTPSKRL